MQSAPSSSSTSPVRLLLRRTGNAAEPSLLDRPIPGQPRVEDGDGGLRQQERFIPVFSVLS
jgi:hypothetical protein